MSVFEVWSAPGGAILADPVHETECIHCLLCEIVCPTDAIHVLVRRTSDDTLDSLLRRV
ncbi:MAG: 4Fe-4S binding protein [Candidatus Thorarchaeota archaeon]|nr:4Fe-4S binding protein [Candidatus Thorarchaeota archaeon]